MLPTHTNAKTESFAPIEQYQNNILPKPSEVKNLSSVNSKSTQERIVYPSRSQANNNQKPNTSPSVNPNYNQERIVTSPRSNSTEGF
jgi:hypothetical protein